MNTKDASTATRVEPIVRQRRLLVVQKVCDECGHDSAVITLPIDRSPQDVRTGDKCQCPECELRGTIILHDATPSSDDIEDTFDVAWIDPVTGGDYRH